jgi:chromosome condensin MukBEF complex kleisin-like MukF subunit
VEKSKRGGITLEKLQKQKLIKAEIAELSKCFKNIEADKKNYADRLIKETAFMSATLQELQDTINKDGVIENFKNGSQEMLREHPASKTYNSMIKHYQSYIKQLCDMTPVEVEEQDALEKFLSKGKK